MDDNCIYLDKEITSGIFNNIDMGIIVIINNNLIYLNKFIFNEFGVSFDYLKSIRY